MNRRNIKVKMKKVDIHQLEGQDSLGTVELLDIIQQG